MARVRVADQNSDQNRSASGVVGLVGTRWGDEITKAEDLARLVPRRGGANIRKVGGFFACFSGGEDKKQDSCNEGKSWALYYLKDIPGCIPEYS